MGQFPVLYSTASPSGQTKNVRANLDLNTNAGEIGKSLANLGSTLGQIGADMQIKEDASEVSTLDRQIHENWNAEYTSLQSTQDPEERVKIHNKAMQDRSSIMDSAKRPNVKSAIQQRINSYEPQFESHFNNLDKKMRDDKGLDELKLNVTSAVSRGDYKSAEQAVGLATHTGLINDSEGGLMLLNAKSDIDKQISANNKNEALAIGRSQRKDDGTIDSKKAEEEIYKLKGLTEEEKLDTLKNINDLSAQEKKADDANWDSSVNQWDGDVQKYIKDSPYDGIQWLETLEATPSKQTELLKYKEEKKALFRSQLSGKDNFDNQIEIDTLNDDAVNVYTGDMKREDYLKKIDDLYTKHELTTDSRDKLRAKMDNPLTPEQAKTVQGFVYDTRQQILSVATGGMTMDLGGGQSITLGNVGANKETELQNRLKWANMYERQLTEWVLKNDGNVGREFVQEAERLRVVFTNASYQDLKQKVAQSERTGSKVGDIVSKGGKQWKITGFTPEGKTTVDEVK